VAKKGVVTTDHLQICRLNQAQFQEKTTGNINLSDETNCIRCKRKCPIFETFGQSELWCIRSGTLMNADGIGFVASSLGWHRKKPASF